MASLDATQMHAPCSTDLLWINRQGAGWKPPSSAKRLEAEDLPEGNLKHDVRAVRILPVLVATVESVFVAVPKALPKIVVVLVLVDVVARVAKVRVLIGERAPVVGLPAILPVRLSSAEALLVTVVHGLTQQVCTVLIRLVVSATAMVTIDRSRVEIRIMIVIVVAVVTYAYLLLAYPLYVVLLITVLRRTVLLL